MTEELRSRAEELAEYHVVKYALDSVREERAFNLLSAALTCGCKSCVAAYFSMVDWLCQDEGWADKIAASQGVIRHKSKKRQFFEGG